MPRCLCFFFNDTATTEIYTLSLHDALPIYMLSRRAHALRRMAVLAYSVWDPLALLVVVTLERRLELLGFDVDIQAGGGVDPRLDIRHGLARLQEGWQAVLMIWHVVVRQAGDRHLPVDMH